jgi:antirestriction protein ArdC
MTDLKDIYSRITAKIIADLEQGVRPWLKTMERRACRRPDYPALAA